MPALRSGQAAAHEQAAQADTELPDQVDTDQHTSVLSKFAINPADLLRGAGGSITSKVGL